METIESVFPLQNDPIFETMDFNENNMETPSKMKKMVVQMTPFVDKENMLPFATPGKFTPQEFKFTPFKTPKAFTSPLGRLLSASSRHSKSSSVDSSLAVLDSSLANCALKTEISMQVSKQMEKEIEKHDQELLKEVEEELKVFEVACTECEELKEHVVCLEEQVLDCKQELTDTIDEMLEQHEELANLRIEIMCQSDALINSQEEVLAYHESYAALQEEGCQLYEMYEVKSIKLDELAKKLELLTKICADTEAENIDLRNKYEECYNNYAEMHSTATQNLEAYNSVQEELQSKEVILIEWESRYSRVQKEMIQLSQQYQDCQIEIAQLLQSQEVFKKTVESNTFEMFNLKEKIATVKVSESIDMGESPNQALIAAHEQLETAESEISSLQMKNEELSTKVTELTSHLYLANSGDETAYKIANEMLRAQIEELKAENSQSMLWKNKADSCDGYSVMIARLKRELSEAREELHSSEIAHGNKIEHLEIEHKQLLDDKIRKFEESNVLIREKEQSLQHEMDGLHLKLNEFIRLQADTKAELISNQVLLKNSQDDLVSMYKKHAAETKAMQQQFEKDGYRLKYGSAMQYYEQLQSLISEDTNYSDSTLLNLLYQELQDVIQIINAKSDFIEQKTKENDNTLMIAKNMVEETEARFQNMCKDLDFSKSSNFELSSRLSQCESELLLTKNLLSEQFKKESVLKENHTLEVDYLKDKFMNECQKVESLTQINEELAQKCSDLQILKEDFELELKRLEEKNTEMQVKLDSHSLSFSDLERNHEALIASQSFLQSDFDEIDRSYNSLKIEFDQSKSEAVVLKNNYDGLSEELEASKIVISNLNAEKEDALALLEDERTVSHDIQVEMKEELDLAQRRHASVEKELRVVSLELHEMNSVCVNRGVQIEELQNTANMYLEQQLKSKEEWEQIQADQDLMTSEMKDQINQLENQVNEMSEQLQDVTSQWKEAMHSKKDLESQLLCHEALLAEANDVILRKTTEMQSIRDESQLCQQNTNQSLLVLQSQLDDSNAQLECSIQNNILLKNENEFSLETIKSLSEKLKLMNEDMEDLSEKYAESCQALSSLQTNTLCSSRKVEEEMQQLLDKNQKLAGEVAILDGQLSAAESSRKKMLADMQTLHVTKTQSNEVQVNLEKANKQISELNVKNSELAELLSNKENELSNLRSAAEANSVTPDIEKLKAEVQLFHNKYVEKKEKEKDLQAMRQKAYKWVIDTFKGASEQCAPNSTTIVIPINELSNLCVGILQAPPFIQTESHKKETEDVEKKSKSSFKRVSLMPNTGNSQSTRFSVGPNVEQK